MNRETCQVTSGHETAVEADDGHGRSHDESVIRLNGEQRLVKGRLDQKAPVQGMISEVAMAVSVEVKIGDKVTILQSRYPESCMPCVVWHMDTVLVLILVAKPVHY
jgi:D-lyxose ketol-isomerase